MNATAIKFVPTALILAAAGACAWPYLGDPPPPPPPADPAAEAALPRVAPELLRPALPARPMRDPFQDPEVLRREARARVARALDDLVNAAAARRKAQATTAAAGPGGRRPAAAAARHGNTGAAAGVAAGADPRVGLTLSATSVSGRRGVAVINGHAYATGETVDDARTDGPCVLAEVTRHQAVLWHRGTLYPLNFPAPGAGAASRRPAAPRPVGSGVGTTAGDDAANPALSLTAGPNGTSAARGSAPTGPRKPLRPAAATGKAAAN